MLFLQIIEVENETSNDSTSSTPTVVQTMKPANENETSNDSNNETLSEVQTENHSTPTAVQTTKRSFPENVLNSNTSKYQKLDTSLDEGVALREASSSSQGTTSKEFIVFGKLIGLQMSQLPLKDAFALQKEIQVKVLEARIRNV